ncbi:hypothetical protein QAD02_011954, partial [Eretmocerus hayati]
MMLATIQVLTALRYALCCTPPPRRGAEVRDLLWVCRCAHRFCAPFNYFDMSFEEMRPKMAYSRSKVVPRIPSNLADAIYDLQNNPKWQGFYQGHVRSDDNRIALIFALHEVIQILRSLVRVRLQADGTFKSTASIFSLMDGKTGPLYNAFWKFVVELIPSLKTNTIVIHLDFEAAAINGAAAYLENADISGCLYHYISAVNQYYENLGIESQQGQKMLEYVEALPFLPPAKIEEGFNFIRNRISSLVPEQAEASTFCNYVFRIWVAIAEIVSVFKRRVKTNNSTENFYMRISRYVKRKCPFWELNDQMKRIAYWEYEEYLRKRNGLVHYQAPDSSNRRFQEQLDELERRMDSPDPIPVDEYLEKIVQLRHDLIYYSQALWIGEDADETPRNVNAQRIQRGRAGQNLRQNNGNRNEANAIHLVQDVAEVYDDYTDGRGDVNHVQNDAAPQARADVTVCAPGRGGTVQTAARGGRGGARAAARVARTPALGSVETIRDRTRSASAAVRAGRSSVGSTARAAASGARSAAQAPSMLTCNGTRADASSHTDAAQEIHSGGRSAIYTRSKRSAGRSSNNIIPNCQHSSPSERSPPIQSRDQSSPETNPNHPRSEDDSDAD